MVFNKVFVGIHLSIQMFIESLQSFSFTTSPNWQTHTLSFKP